MRKLVVLFRWFRSKLKKKFREDVPLGEEAAAPHVPFELRDRE